MAKRKRRKPVERGPAFVPCGQCSNGWITRILYDGHPAAVRCWCWVSHQQTLAKRVIA